MLPELHKSYANFMLNNKKSANGVKKCSKCAEEIKSEAKVCKHCGAKQKGSVGCGGAILIVFILGFMVTTMTNLDSGSSDSVSPQPKQRAREATDATQKSPGSPETITTLESRLQESLEAEIITSWSTDGIDDEIFVIYLNPTVWSTTTVQNKKAYVLAHGKLAREAGYDSAQFRDAFTDKQLARYGYAGQVQLLD